MKTYTIVMDRAGHLWHATIQGAGRMPTGDTLVNRDFDTLVNLVVISVRSMGGGFLRWQFNEMSLPLSVDVEGPFTTTHIHFDNKPLVT